MEIFLHSFPMPIGFHGSGQSNHTQFLFLYSSYPMNQRRSKSSNPVIKLCKASLLLFFWSLLEYIPTPEEASHPTPAPSTCGRRETISKVPSMLKRVAKMYILKALLSELNFLKSLRAVRVVPCKLSMSQVVCRRKCCSCKSCHPNAS
jgi:hypothetical protein